MSRTKANVVQLDKRTRGAPKAAPAEISKHIAITPPKFQTATITIRGTVPYVQHAFSQKAVDMIKATQEAGSVARKGKKREAKDFDEVFKAATHFSKEGWPGIPATAFRNAMISACRTVGFKMTLAKLSLSVIADGFGADGTPLIKINGPYHRDIRPARNDNGSIDLRARPMWPEGWTAKVRVRWDSDQFDASDVLNLMHRVGMQVGIGEGRNDSRNSAGVGWGEFEVVQ